MRPIHYFHDIFNVMRYPAGESHVAIRNETLGYLEKPIIIHPYCRNFDDLGQIVTADKILQDLGEPDSAWFIPYFPFGRHDRRRFTGDGLELSIALKMVERLNIITLDPHSDVLGQLPHVPQKSVVELANELFEIWSDNPTVVIPDAGATKKAYTWATGKDICQASKVRNPDTGELSHFTVDRDAFEGDCLIVDDICDGGGTFIGLADILRGKGAESLTLLVSHGLFTKGTDELSKHFDNIICASTVTKTTTNETHKVLTISYEEIFDRGEII